MRRLLLVGVLIGTASLIGLASQHATVSHRAPTTLQALRVTGLSARDVSPSPQPSLKAITEKTSFQLTNCDTHWLSCSFRDLVVGSKGDQLVVPVGETGAGAPAPVSPYLSLKGDHQGKAKTFSETDVVFTPAAGGSPATVTVDLGDGLPADHYTGAFVLGVADNADPLLLPVDLQVRVDPFWPAVVLIGTVLLGAALAWVFGQRPKVDFQAQADDFVARVRQLPAAERGILLRGWQHVRTERVTDFASAQKHLTALVAGIDALRQCRDAQDEALRTPGFSGALKWVERIGGATAKVVQAIEGFQAPYDTLVGNVIHTEGEFKAAAAAKETMDSLDRRAKAAQNAGQPYLDFLAASQAVHAAVDGVSPDPSQAAPDLTAPLTAAKDAFAKLQQATQSALPEPVGAPVAAGVGGGAILTTLLGWPAPTGASSQAISKFGLAVVAGRLLGPVAATIAFFVLLGIGFKTTYLDNPAFGATLSDWFALIIWGLAAYGARRTLTELGATPSPSG